MSMSILIDEVSCARQLNARNTRVIDSCGAKGRGVFAAVDLLPGEIVVKGVVARMDRSRTTNSIQLDWNVHALFEEPVVILNHSCDPNLAIVPNHLGAYDFIAVRQIASGDEVCFDYATTESECIGVSVCLCSAANCRGSAAGFDKLPRDHPLVVSGFHAPYLSLQKSVAISKRIGILQFGGF
ncbi:SET domain-containing protein-lysine N-methyltransferase [Mesorhizobium sp. M0761]|uniref:SET domain-containing protein-lysine N-methyltransferase n=1 Tax=Mesorhizobium sp. M0761 TaxID=2956994 RepID=UPI00333AE31C